MLILSLRCFLLLVSSQTDFVLFVCVSLPQVRAGSAADPERLFPYVSVGDQTSYTFPPVKLVHGMRYVIEVRATSCEGLSVTAKSNGVVVDQTAPEPAAVRVVHSEHDDLVVDYQNYLYGVRAAWESWEDPGTARVYIQCMIHVCTICIHSVMPFSHHGACQRVASIATILP